ncbi:MAG: creatininase family protein [Enhydrobacter sp.]|nr:creatininase family protein [Enhydrobacter sp.]
MSAGVWLEELTWVEAKARFDADAVVIIPIGAASKAHGGHLPLKTDALTARALGQRLIERLPVIAAPVVGFGYYPAFTPFAGSQHLTAGTFKAVLRELIASLTAHGVRRVALVNTGVSTETPLDEVAAEIGALVLHMRLMGRAADPLIEHKEGGHADERETSVVLALDPRSVRMDRLAPAPEFGQSAATGDPTRASAFKGERLLAAWVDDMVAALVARWPDLGAL